MSSNFEVNGIRMEIKGSLNNLKVDFKEIIRKSEFHWQLMNERFTPVCMAKIDSLDSDKKIIVRLWKTGRFNIAGVKSWQEFHRVSDMLNKDLENIFGVKVRQ